MREVFSLLDELNIDDEFKKILIRLSNQINEHINLYKASLDDDQKITHLNFAYFLLSLVEDSYPDNTTYQSLINFLKKDIEGYRQLIKRNSYCEVDLLKAKIKPTVH